jgi:hypothetical protein
MITAILIALVAIIGFAIYRNNTNQSRRKQTNRQTKSASTIAQTFPFMTSNVDLLMADVPANTPYEIGYDQMKF